MTAPARAAAHRVLRTVHTGRADLATAQARATHALKDPRDRALAAEITVGVLRWRARLDHLLAQVSSRTLDRVDPAILDILRAGAHQILYLERVPDHAAVDDAVALTRRARKTSAASFVNAVLRALASRPPLAALPPRPAAAPGAEEPDREQALAYLSITQSHPRWLMERWLDRYGFEAAERWTAFNNAPAPVTLRVNTIRTSAQDLTAQLAARGVEVVPGRWSPRTLVVRRGNPLATDLAGRGLFLVQDEASQLVAELAAARPSQRVLDACAAPGGKTVAIAGSMSNRGLIVAADLRPARVALLARTLAGNGCRNTRVVRLDARRPLPFRAVFDRVLVDAPCSGLGTLRRDPDIRWRCTAGDLPALAATQAALLRAAAAVVAPGGRLIYATCSSEPEENHLVVDKLLAGGAPFTPERAARGALAPLIDAKGHFQTLPHRDGLEAFFAAVLQRRGGGAD